MAISTCKYPKIKCVLQWIHHLKVDLLERAYATTVLAGTLNNLMLNNGTSLLNLFIVNCEMRLHINDTFLMFSFVEMLHAT